MQRASSANTKPSANRTVSTSQPTTPASEPALIRQKINHTPDSSAPTTPLTEPPVYASRSDVKAAIQAQSTFEALAKAKRAELGFGHNEYETDWVLNISVPGRNSEHAQNTLNGEDESESEEEQSAGRQTFGGYKRRKTNPATTYALGSKPSTPAQSYKFDDFDSGSESPDSDDGEVDSDSDAERKTPSSSKKRKANAIDEADEVAMSALDRVDLSKTGYAKAKKATPTGKWSAEQGGQKKGKYQPRGSRGKKLGRKKQLD